jgi:hypothetical protein
MQWVLASLLLFFGAVSASAQAGPNCTNINAALDENGNVNVDVQEFVTNCTDALAAGNFSYTVYNQFNGIVAHQNIANCDDPISFSACGALGRTYKVKFTNPLGSCWSDLTFKQSNGPLLMGNTYHLYCLEEEVGDIGLYLDRFYGDNDDVYEPSVDHKNAYIPCFDPTAADFVADWVDPFPCDIGVDTAKIIYREFEAYDKNGNRGYVFDTIYVYRLPELTDMNVYCAERDTAYCGESASGGPYMVAPELDSMTGLPTGECDTLYFLVVGNLKIHVHLNIKSPWISSKLVMQMI